MESVKTFRIQFKTVIYSQFIQAQAKNIRLKKYQNTKTHFLGLNWAKTVFFPLLLVVFPLFWSTNTKTANSEGHLY